MSDKNLIRISGDGLGNIWVDDVLTFRADQPGMRELHFASIVVAQGDGIADALKIGGVCRLRVTVDNLDARFAAEDAIDINHSEAIEVLVARLIPAAKYAGTIKGASKDVLIAVGSQLAHGGETDWDLGNFSDQGNDRTTGVRLSVQMRDSSAVRVRVLSADRPVILNPEQRYAIEGNALLTRFFYPVFNALKDLLRTFGRKI